MIELDGSSAKELDPNGEMCFVCGKRATLAVWEIQVGDLWRHLAYVGCREHSSMEWENRFREPGVMAMLLSSEAEDGYRLFSALKFFEERNPK